MTAFAALLDDLPNRLLWTSAQACLLIGAITLAGRLLPRLPAAARCMLWWLVAAQLVLGLAWHAPMQLRWLPAPVAATAPMMDAAPSVAQVAPQRIWMPPTPAVAAAEAPTEPTWWSWPRALLALWSGGVLLQLALAARQARQAARARHHARPAPPTLQAACDAQARRCGLRRLPRLALSPVVDSPQVLGPWRPLVLFPLAARLSEEETALAMAHELAHLARGDLWLGWVPALAQRLFFFHPLVVWAMREYALSREAACDAQALACTGGAPQAYGQLLLRLGVAAPLSSGLAGASPTFRNLKRRLSMLQHTDASPRRARGWLLVIAIALIGVIPYRVTAGSPHPADAGTPTQHVLPAPPAPPAAPVSAPPALPPPPPTAPPVPPPPPRDFGPHAHHVDIDTHDHAPDGFALFDGDTVIVNGADSDVDAARRLHTGNAAMLWFRQGDKAYLTRDTAIIARARAIYAPLGELSRAQGRLAGQQGELAGRQSGLAARDAGFAQEQAELAREQAALAAEQAAAPTGKDSEAARQALATREQALEARQADLEQRHATLEQTLATQQHALEARQGAFEKQQQALELRQQAASRDAYQQIRQLLEDAVRQGKAEPASPSR